jgi:16S rRNA (guanine1516-N2)-methyltransferase
MNHRINSGNRKELLIKALGIKPSIQHDVFDATAGLGKDSFIIASRGATVTMFEKNPIIFILLENGLMRANNDDKISNISTNMSLINSDFLEYTPDKKPYAVYLDPMFPERRKSALVKKDMQIFHIILHNTTPTDENLMLQKALDIAEKKVVVKRPIKAPNLAGKCPNHVVLGKTCRYDVYLCRVC